MITPEKRFHLPRNIRRFAVPILLASAVGGLALLDKLTHPNSYATVPIPISTPVVDGQLISIPYLPKLADYTRDCLPEEPIYNREPIFSPIEELEALKRVSDFRNVFKRVINTEGILKGLTLVDDAHVLNPDFDSRALYDQVFYQTVFRGNPHFTLNSWQPKFSDTRDGQGFAFITSYPECNGLRGATVGTRLNPDLLSRMLGHTVDATDPRVKRIKEDSLKEVMERYLNVPANATFQLGFDNEHFPAKTPALRFTGRYPDGSRVEGMLDVLGTIRVFVE